MGQLQNMQYIYNGNSRRKKRERNRRHIEAMSENHRSRISENTKQDKYPPTHTQKDKQKQTSFTHWHSIFTLQKMKDKEILKRALVCEEPYVYRGINNFI